MHINWSQDQNKSLAHLLCAQLQNHAKFQQLEGLIIRLKANYVSCLQYAAEVLSNNEHFRLDDSYGLCIMLQPAWPSTLLQLLNISISAILRAIFFVASSVDPIFHHPH